MSINVEGDGRGRGPGGIDGANDVRRLRAVSRAGQPLLAPLGTATPIVP